MVRQRCAARSLQQAKTLRNEGVRSGVARDNNVVFRNSGSQLEHERRSAAVRSMSQSRLRIFRFFDSNASVRRKRRFANAVLPQNATDLEGHIDATHADGLFLRPDDTRSCFDFDLCGAAIRRKRIDIECVRPDIRFRLRSKQRRRENNVILCIYPSKQATQEKITFLGVHRLSKPAWTSSCACR